MFTALLIISVIAGTLILAETKVRIDAGREQEHRIDIYKNSWRNN